MLHEIRIIVGGGGGSDVSITRKSGLKPLIDENSQLLILGTLPGDKSISVNEYYANPSNEFWSIIYKALDVPYRDNIVYEDKKALLQRYHIALWDVLCDADRPGSADKNISDETLNDLDSLFFEYPLLRRVIINCKGLNFAQPSRKYKQIAKALSPVFAKYDISPVFLHSTSRWIRKKSVEINIWYEVLRNLVFEKEK